MLERRLDYPDEQASGTEYAVVDEHGDSTVYRVWEQRFSRASIERLLADTGFELEHLRGDLTGEPWRAQHETFAVVARRT